MASSKGLVVGALRYRTAEGVVVDCSVAQVGVPSFGSEDSIEVLPSEALFVLVVEKDSSFQVGLRGRGGVV